MASLIRNRASLIWLVLVLATLVSFETMQLGENGARVLRAIILLIAFGKVLLVGREFMELRQAPRLLLWFFQAWVGIVCCALIVLYW